MSSPPAPRLQQTVSCSWMNKGSQNETDSQSDHGACNLLAVPGLTTLGWVRDSMLFLALLLHMHLSHIISLSLAYLNPHRTVSLAFRRWGNWGPDCWQRILLGKRTGSGTHYLQLWKWVTFPEGPVCFLLGKVTLYALPIWDFLASSFHDQLPWCILTPIFLKLWLRWLTFVLLLGVNVLHCFYFLFQCYRWEAGLGTWLGGYMCGWVL